MTGGFSRRSFLFFFTVRVSLVIKQNHVDLDIKYLFSQWGCYSPVLEFLYLWNCNIDGFPLYMLQDGIILRGSQLLYTRNRHKKPPWPGDFKRWMRVIHSELRIRYIHSELYFWCFMSSLGRRQVPFILFMPIIFFQDYVVLIAKVKKVKVCCQAMSSLSDTRVLLFSEELMETISLSENNIQRNGGETPERRSLKTFMQQNESKILLYGSKSKRILMSCYLLQRKCLGRMAM